MKRFRELRKLGNLLVAVQLFSIVVQPHYLLAYKQSDKAKRFVETLFINSDLQHFCYQKRAPRPNPYPSIFPDLSKDPQEKIQLPRDITIRNMNVTNNLTVEGSTYIAGDIIVEGGITVDVTETTGPISLLDQGEIRFYES